VPKQSKTTKRLYGSVTSGKTLFPLLKQWRNYPVWWVQAEELKCSITSPYIIHNLRTPQCYIDNKMKSLLPRPRPRHGDMIAKFTDC